jgi:hypothetical protein
MVLLGVLLTALTACGREKVASAEDTASAAASEKRTDGKRKRKPKKDLGEASMLLGDLEWEASSAKASLNKEYAIHSITARRSEYSDGKSKSQALTLRVMEFNGPGSYRADTGGSHFIAVGVGTKAAEEAKTDEQTTALATDTLTKAKRMILGNAEVIVESVSEKEVIGTFSWQPPPKYDYPPITNGKFRAIIKRKKKKAN